jgi:hypothetical protein
MGRGYAAPTAGQRIGRGLGWGMLLGQMWTLYIAVVLMVLGGIGAATSGGAGAGLIGLGIAVILVLVAIGNAFVFGIAGFIIGAADMDDDAGAIVGIVASLLIVGGQFLIGLRGGIGLIAGFFFAISFGRGVGAAIAKKVQGG